MPDKIPTKRILGALNQQTKKQDNDRVVIKQQDRFVHVMIYHENNTIDHYRFESMEDEVLQPLRIATWSVADRDRCVMQLLQSPGTKQTFVADLLGISSRIVRRIAQSYTENIS